MMMMIMQEDGDDVMMMIMQEYGDDADDDARGGC